MGIKKKEFLSLDNVYIHVFSLTHKGLMQYIFSLLAKKSYVILFFA